MKRIVQLLVDIEVDVGKDKDDSFISDAINRHKLFLDVHSSSGYSLKTKSQKILKIDYRGE